MTAIRVMVLRAAGINCDEETAHAWASVGGEPTAVHIHRLIASPGMLDEFQIVTIPGGFSYGDDIASGKILAGEIARNLGEPLRRFVERGGLLLGICNGFQVLVKAGLLPGGELAQRVTITHNESGRYEDRWVYVQAACSHCAFVRPGMRLRLPVAHGEGKVTVDSETTLAALKTGRHIAFQYCDAEGNAGGFPINPNGSEAEIAGLTDATGRIFGLMPHPERALEATHVPDWTRSRPTVGPGRAIFEAAIESLRSGAAARADSSMNAIPAQR